MIRIGHLALTLIAVMAATAVQARDRIVVYGEIVATDACSACHQVGPRQRRPGAVYDDEEDEDVLAPRFTSIAKKHGHDEKYLRQKILFPRHVMREQSWNEADLKAVIAYIKSLDGSAAKRTVVKPH